MKKHLILGSVMLQLLLMIGCSAPQPNDGLCHIDGTANSRFEGVKIFLVPMNEPAIAQNVDSVVITDGKFQFTSEPGKLKSIRVDYRHRIGVEELLVITEPGNLEVVIDTVSSSKGTPQNDSLQAWKEYSARHFTLLKPYRKQLSAARKSGDTLTMTAVKAQIDSIGRIYKQYSRSMADEFKEGALYDFLYSRFPTSYKKKMPNGEIVTIQLD